MRLPGVRGFPCIGPHCVKDASDTDLVKYLSPSMVETVRPDDPCSYALYIAYDEGDGFYDSEEGRESVESSIAAQWEGHEKGQIPIRWVRVLPYEDGGNGPVRAWNEAFAQAYEDEFPYFFWLGEDTRLLTSGWGEALSSKLHEEFEDVGTVGPREVHFQSDRVFCPITMVHRSHMELFNSLFPPDLHNWYSDDWMNTVYADQGRFALLEDQQVENQHDGLRYKKAQDDGDLALSLVGESSRRFVKYLDDNPKLGRLGRVKVQGGLQSDVIRDGDAGESDAD